MVRRIIFAVLIISLIPLLMACDEAGVDLTPRVAALEAWKSVAEAQAANGNAAYSWKVNTFDPWMTTFNAWKAQVDVKMGTTAGPAPSIDLSQYVTITTYNAKVSDFETRIKALEAGGGGTGGTGGSDSGSVQFTNNPVSIPQIFSSSTGGNSNPWIMTIKNNSSTWQYVKPVITLSIASGQSQTTVTELVVIASGSSCNMTGEIVNTPAPATPTITGNFSFSPTTMCATSTPSVVAFPISGCNNSLGEIYIGPGQSQMINIQIQLKTAAITLWNVSTSISSRSM